MATFSQLGVTVTGDLIRRAQQDDRRIVQVIYVTETQVQNDGSWYYFEADPTSDTGIGSWSRRVWVYRVDMWISDTSGELLPMGTGYFDYRIYDRSVTALTDTRDKRLVEYLGGSGDDYDEVTTSTDFQLLFSNNDGNATLPFAVRVGPTVVTPFNRGYVSLRATGLFMI